MALPPMRVYRKTFPMFRFCSYSIIVCSFVDVILKKIYIHIHTHVYIHTYIYININMNEMLGSLVGSSPTLDECCGWIL